VAKKEGITAENAALNIIAQKADGGMRDALSIFDQVSSFCGGNITYQQTIENLNVLDYDYYFRLTDYFLEEKITECMLTLNEILSKGFEGQYFITGLSSHFRNLLVSQDAQTASLIEASEEVRTKYKEQAQKCKPQFLFKAMKLANNCDLNYKQSQNKRLLVELTLIEMAQLSSDDGISSGLCPTKILKPIFERLKNLPKNDEGSLSGSASAERSHTPSATPAHTTALPPRQNTLTTPSSTPAPQGRPMGGVFRFSIRNTGQQASNSQQQEAKESTQSINVQKLEDKEFDTVALTIAWREFAIGLPREETAMSRQMDNMEPSLLEDGTTFLVIADNPSVMNELNKIKPRVEAFLQQRLQNHNVRMTTRLREVTDKRVSYTRREILNMMLEQSEALRKLKEEFELELT
jgi:DNA polymerase-3 subunit gamma/tau